MGGRRRIQRRPPRAPIMEDRIGPYKPGGTCVTGAFYDMVKRDWQRVRIEIKWSKLKGAVTVVRYAADGGIKHVGTIPKSRYKKYNGLQAQVDRCKDAVTWQHTSCDNKSDEIMNLKSALGSTTRKEFEQRKVIKRLMLENNQLKKQLNLACASKSN